jgi:cold shock CspA family protein
MFKFGSHQDRDRVKDKAMQKFEKKTRLQELIGKRARGEIVSFSKSFGFATIGHGEPELFLHITNVKKSRVTSSGYRLFRPGDRVEFTVQENPRRPGSLMAVDVSLLDSESENTRNGDDHVGEEV